MTMMVKTLVALRDEPADWVSRQLDYRDRADLMASSPRHSGRASTARPKALEDASGVKVIEADVGFFNAEMDYPTLKRFWGPDAQIREAYGEHPPAQAAGKSVADLDPERLRIHVAGGPLR